LSDLSADAIKKAKLVKKKTMKPEKEEKKKEAEKSMDYSILNMNLDFKMDEVKLRVEEDDGDPFFDLSIQNLLVAMAQKPGLTKVNVKLETIELQDYLFEFTNPNYTKFLTSVPPQNRGSKEFLFQVDVFMMERSHPDYSQKMTDMGVSVKIGYIFVNFKPDTMGAMMKFFKGDPDSPKVADERQEVVT